MSNLLQAIASLEWMALGVMFLTGLIKWNKKLASMYDELQKQFEEEGADNG